MNSYYRTINNPMLSHTMIPQKIKSFTKSRIIANWKSGWAFNPTQTNLMIPHLPSKLLSHCSSIKTNLLHSQNFHQNLPSKNNKLSLKIFLKINWYWVKGFTRKLKIITTFWSTLSKTMNLPFWSSSKSNIKN